MKELEIMYVGGGVGVMVLFPSRRMRFEGVVTRTLRGFFLNLVSGFLFLGCGCSAFDLLNVEGFSYPGMFRD